jgi:NitT/TauT family transport system ATP-binding protein
MKLEVRQLEKTYRTESGSTQALMPTSFEIGDGEFVSLLGPSGCGKTTTLYMIAGLESASGGEILLNHKRVTGPCPERGMVFQNYTLFPWLTVSENARFSFELAENLDYTRSTGEIMADIGRAYSLLDLMGLHQFYDAYPRELSGGMKQRVAIARALVNRPAVLLMDEPFGALDAQTREEMQELMLLLHAYEKTTVLFVTHDIEEAIYLSTRILVFSARPGRIIRDVRVPFAGRTPELKLDPEFIRLKRELVGLLHRDQRSGIDREALLRKLVPQQN